MDEPLLSLSCLKVLNAAFLPEARPCEHSKLLVQVKRQFSSEWVDSETTYVILHGLFGGVELLVVGAATRLMN